MQTNSKKMKRTRFIPCIASASVAANLVFIVINALIAVLVLLSFVSLISGGF